MHFIARPKRSCNYTQPTSLLSKIDLCVVCMYILFLQGKKGGKSRLVTQIWAACAIRVQAGSECPSGAAGVTLMRLHSTQDQWAGLDAPNRRAACLAHGAWSRGGPAARTRHAKRLRTARSLSVFCCCCCFFFSLLRTGLAFVSRSGRASLGSR